MANTLDYVDRELIMVVKRVIVQDPAVKTEEMRKISVQKILN